MSKQEKLLPKPPNTPFGRKRHFEEDESKDPLIADEMVQAMAEGKLEEFLKKELPDNEYARKLAEMMMGMTGMLHRFWLRFNKFFLFSYVINLYRGLAILLIVYRKT